MKCYIFNEMINCRGTEKMILKKENRKFIMITQWIIAKQLTRRYFPLKESFEINAQNYHQCELQWNAENYQMRLSGASYVYALLLKTVS